MWAEALGPLELELWEVVNRLTGVLGNELRFSARAVCVLSMKPLLQPIVDDRSLFIRKRK